VLSAVAATAAAAIAALGPAAGAVETRAELGPRVVVRGLASPVGLAAPRSERGRLYVVEQAGTIRVVVNGRRRAAPFLDIRSRVRSGGEQGLLGLAFHPDYATNRRFYVNYTDRNGNTNVVEYRSNGTRALAGSARRLLFVRQPYSNHNGGGLAFGPDGALYVGMGDGGSGGDPENRAQSMSSRLGKLLRIDVDRRPARVRIAALGLRNPWRFAFDRRTGDLYIADVGQNALEEINFLPRSRLGALQNYGWDVYEGRSSFEDKALGRGRLVMPVAQYGRNLGCSVTGGLPYRGRATSNAGRYF
jgi:glucose/arabinose dehydrogenase